MNKWTADQQKAISHRGNDILVTASAGTGKTAVLSGRCVDIVSDRSACPDVRSILVLTFTEAAAAEMKTRIGQALKDKYCQSRDSHLKRQLLLLDAAEISTIHSFCKRLITEYFYKLGIDPAFRVIDEDEQFLLKKQVCDEVVLEACEDSALAPAILDLLKGRSTNCNFLDLVIDIYNYLDSVVSRPKWFVSAEEFSACINPDLGLLGHKQRQIVKDKLDDCIKLLQYSIKLDGRLADGHWREQIEEDFLAEFNECSELIARGNFDEAADRIRKFAKPRNWNRKPEGLSDEIAELVKQPAAEALIIFKNLKHLAVINPAYLDIVSGSANRQTKTLVELCKRFGARYGRLKTQLNCLDFADLEHLAFELLTNKDNGGPSDIAVMLRGRFKHIFVDEYQDINAVQQAIIERLSCNNNVFVVGDIKQSIYAFRQAQPEIFLQKLTCASDEPADSDQGLRIDLGGNFRSRSQILDFVNEVFSHIMTASFADIDYDYKARLSPCAEYKPLDEVINIRPIPPLVEMHLINNSPDTGNPHANSATGLEPNESQAAVIAMRIREMVDTAEFKIFDKSAGSYRNVEYRDIVILMRSPANKAADYIRILRIMGVPVSSQSSSGYFETTEITDCVSLLSTLDNPQRDIEFAAVLRSPFFNTTDTELAKIRFFGDTCEKAALDSDSSVAAGRNNFYQAVILYSQFGPDQPLRDKLSVILKQLDSWRTAARRASIADLIWDILRSTGYLSFVSALPNGRQRRANLLKLHERAIQFEGFITSGRTVSLSRFVEFIQKLLDQGQDWAPAEPDSAAENAVRIMSVHKSKGLEFPVVFVAELETGFNSIDRHGQCLIDSDHALGIEIIDPESGGRIASIGHQIISEVKKSAELAEEMRILYVALTRARERLVLAAQIDIKQCRDILQKASFLDETAVPDWILSNCQSPLEWLLYSLGAHSLLHSAFDISSVQAASAVRGQPGLFSVDLYGPDKLNRLYGQIESLRKNSRTRQLNTDNCSAAAGLDLQKLKAALGWQYPFAEISGLAAKTSVSRLTHRGDEFAPKPIVQLPQLDLLEDASKNRSQLLGTAVHLLMQRIDLSDISARSLRASIQGLVSEGAVSEDIAARIDTKAITVFFESDLGELVRDPNNIIHREWPFTFALPAEYLTKGLDGLAGALHAVPESSPAVNSENVIVQGIIDLLIQTPEGLIVIDFKTDRITAGQTQGRAQTYAGQMNLYSLAAQAILGRPVKARYLYFLGPGSAVEIQ